MSAITPAVLWAIFGFLLLLVELFTMGFVLVFFGVAAILVAGCKSIFGLDHLALELLLFALFGSFGLFVFRQKLVRALGKGSPEPAIDRKQVVTLTAALPPRGSGKIEYQGAPWDAFNDSDSSLKAGDKVVIVATEGIRLIVRPEA